MRRQQRRGANALEFALILPVFLAILFALIDISWLMYRRTMMDVALQEACREASLIDPGLNGDNVDAIIEKANTRALERLAQLANCEGCTASALITGPTRRRTVVCTLNDSYTPLTSLTFGVVPLQSGTAFQLEFQRGT